MLLRLRVVVVCFLFVCGGLFAEEWCEGVNREAGREFLAAYEGEPDIYRRLAIEQSDRALVGSFEDPRAAFLAYLEIRLRPYSVADRKRIRRIYESAEITFLPGAASVAGRFVAARQHLRLWVNPLLRESAFQYAALAHEVEHAIQARDPRYDHAPSTPYEREKYDKEFGAVRAEYEYLTLLSQNARESAIHLASGLTETEANKDFSRTACMTRMGSVREGFSEYRRSHIYHSFESTSRHYGRTN